MNIVAAPFIIYVLVSRQMHAAMPNIIGFVDIT